MFIAVKIDTNTAETFRHGIWYVQGDLKPEAGYCSTNIGSVQRIFYGYV